ncbi:DUF6461 domain-containing protein [Streptomyces sp. NPDC051740]|uniref:DUF6461 domain-containing protein n=1 Tax=Streptomyces sp. NPDC051740 TaxID=3365673 RepID=UPI0037A7E7B2
MPSSWRLSDSENFCLSLTLHKSPEEVMEIYGADLNSARLMHAKDIPDAPPLGTVICAGQLGEWSFCIEFEDFIGSTSKVMRDLSHKTESIILFRTAKALKSFQYVTDGRIVEQFEPGFPSSVHGESSHAFAEQVHVLTAASTRPIAASLEVIARYTGHELTTEQLHGPLLTTVIDEPDRVALRYPDPPLQYPEVPQRSSRRTGRPLGRLP